MKTKYMNDAIIGGGNITASLTEKGELLRVMYPAPDFRNWIDEFLTGVKINDSGMIYLHEDINNQYHQYYTENTNVLDDRNYDGTYVDEIPDSVKTEAERKGLEDVPTTPTNPEPTNPEPTKPEPTKPEPTKPIESTPIVKTGFKEDVAKYRAIGAVAAAVLFALANIGVKVSETGSELMMVTGSKESSIKPKKSRKNIKRK